MYNYTDFFIDKIKTFTLADNDLNAILPQANIRKKHQKNPAEFPSVVVQTIENTADSFSFSQEAITTVGIQIDINCQDMIIGSTVEEAGEACSYIAYKIANHLEDDLHLARLTLTDPIPTDIENQVFTMFMRYRIKHDLLKNLISK